MSVLLIITLLCGVCLATLEPGVVVEYDVKSDSAIFESPIKVCIMYALPIRAYESRNTVYIFQTKIHLIMRA